MMWVNQTCDISLMEPRHIRLCSTGVNYVKPHPLLHDSASGSVLPRLVMDTPDGLHIPPSSQHSSYTWLKCISSGIAKRDQLRCDRASPQLHGTSMADMGGLWVSAQINNYVAMADAEGRPRGWRSKGKWGHGIGWLFVYLSVLVRGHFVYWPQYFRRVGCSLSHTSSSKFYGMSTLHILSKHYVFFVFRGVSNRYTGILCVFAWLGWYLC